MRIERLSRQDVLAIHAMQIAWFGGPSGFRGEELLDSALAQVPSFSTGSGGITRLLAVLAAGYATGIATTRPFVDGNRRTALIAAFTLIERNGFAVTASQQDAFTALYNLGLGKPTEAEFADWLQSKIVPVPR
jgi:death-on-curing protein